MDQVARAEPDIAIDVPAMPERIAVSGVEFVEFAADEAEAEELAALLRAMGFRSPARHKNKDVALYRQGGINIVVNTEKEGLAHSSYLVHGTSAYAIGLKVEDAAATVARARALGAEPFEQRHGPGELAIPAIRGRRRRRHLLHRRQERTRPRLGDRVRAGRRRPADDAGPAPIDHVAQTMNYEEMLTWLLFYTSIFRTQKTPMVDVVDPAGLVRSQVDRERWRRRCG